MSGARVLDQEIERKVAGDLTPVYTWLMSV